MPLPIYKKIFVSEVPDHFYFVLQSHTQKAQNFFYTYDPFKKWFYKPIIENFLLMPLLIYKKFLTSGSESKIFTNKFGFGPPSIFMGLQSPKLVKILQMTPNPNGIKLVGFSLRAQKLAFTSKFRIRVGCHAH